MSPNDTYPQHVVTAVIVAHDGAAWLPHVIDALLGQTRPVQRVVAVDTGSRDRSGAVLAEQLGQPVVFGMDRATGYGAAVARRSAPGGDRPGAGLPGGAAAASGSSGSGCCTTTASPPPDALEQLLRGAAETSPRRCSGPR